MDQILIEAWARECIAEDWDDHLPGYYRDMDIERFAELVRAAALEECATVIRALMRQPTG